MDAQRRAFLERNMEAQLTEAEIAEGYCFCVCWDGMLLHRDWPEAKDCCDVDCSAKVLAIAIPTTGSPQ